MAQKFLHAAQVCTTVQQVSRKAVAEGVRAGRVGQPRLRLPLFQRPAYASSRQTCALPVEEKCFLTRSFWYAIRRPEADPERVGLGKGRPLSSIAQQTLKPLVLG